jgi:hypothetical protein
VPKDLPPRSTLHGWLIRWHCDGVLDRLHFALYQEARELKRFPSDLNQWDSQEVEDGRVFVH